MKIGFLVDRIAFGGGERILKMLIDEFCKLKHEISIYTWNKDWNEYENQFRFNIHVMDCSPVGLIGKVYAYKELKKELFVTKPNCLIIFSLGLAEVGVWAAKKNDIPVVLSERVDPAYLPKSKVHRLIRLLVYKECSGIVFQTLQVRNYYSKSIQKKGVVIPNPLMDDNLPNVNIYKSQKEVVAVGRLSEEKNYELLIKAFSDLNIPEYKLRIYGEGPLYGILKQFIDEKGLCEKVLLEGQVDRVVDHIKDSDIFVLSSIHEGMPNVLIEAMAMGLACISTDFSSGGAKSLIMNRVNGLLVPINSIDAMKNAIRELVDNTEFKQSLKINALDIRRTNSKEIILPMWIDFIYSISKTKL